MAQTGAGATEETESLAGSARGREGRMALSSLPSSRLPTVPLLAMHGLGDGPGPADPAVGNREEQGRAGHRPSCSQESQGSRGGGMDTGQTQEEEGCQSGSRQSPSGSQRQQKPQFSAGRDALGCKGQGSGPEVGSHQWSQNPWALPAHIILPAPGFRLQERWAGTVLFGPLAAGGAGDRSSVPPDLLQHCSQESCRPCCFQPVSEPGRGTDAGGSRVHFNR